jgi:hypothetical protein
MQFKPGDLVFVPSEFFPIHGESAMFTHFICKVQGPSQPRTGVSAETLQDCYSVEAMSLGERIDVAIDHMEPPSAMSLVKLTQR